MTVLYLHSNIANVKVEHVVFRTVLTGQADRVNEDFDTCEEAHRAADGKTEGLCTVVQEVADRIYI